jgi:hypothetical protein
MKQRLIFSLAVLLVLSFAFVYADAAPVCWSVNGNCYDRIDAVEPAIARKDASIAAESGINWEDAKTAAESLSFQGVNGHLATITSQEENDFIVNNLGGPDAVSYHWLGGFQPPGSVEPDGGWQWITGEPFVFKNWALGEPNDTGGNEDAIAFHRPSLPSLWNDLPNNARPRGYIVEFPSPSFVNFSDFILKHALIKFNKLSESDRYYIKGSFTLGENSDGIDPLEEVIKLKVGTSNLEIPAGSFFKEGKRKFKFKGKIDDVDVYMRIETLKSNGFRFMTWIKGIDLTDTPNPVPIRLYIGDDMGHTDIWLSGMLKYNGHYEQSR